jgi:antitoxin (DNA-binding transcriptional repressor) of toxin-antitoxin stability system
MAKRLPVRVLGKQWPRILDEVAAGEPVLIVDDDGVIVARIVGPGGSLAEVELLRRLRQSARAPAGPSQVVQLPSDAATQARIPPG